MASAVPGAGELDQRVRIVQATAARDRIGGLVETWATLATVWAKVEPLSAREAYYRAQVNAGATWRVVMRFRSDVTPRQRIAWNGRTFEIRGVTDPDNRRRMIELACDEIVAGDLTPLPTGTSYVPSLDYSDDRNSQYLPVINL